MRQVFVSRTAAPGANTTYANPLNGNSWLSSSVEDRVQCPVRLATTFRNLTVEVATASGTQVFTVRKNGVDTALTVSIVAPATSATITGTDVAFAAGDLISISRVPTTSTGSITRIAIEGETSTTVASIYPTSVSDGTIGGTRYNALLRGETQWGASEDHSTRNVVAVPGTVTGLHVFLENAPGAGESLAFAVYLNGVKQDGTGATVDTGLTISDANATGSVTFSLPVVAGDLVSLEVVPSASAASTRVAYCASFDATTAGQSNFCGRSTSSISNSTTVYQNPSKNGGSGAWTTTEGDHELLVGQTGFTLSNLIVVLNGAPGSGKSYTISGRVNAASPAGAPSVTVADAETDGSDDGEMTLVAEDEFALQSVPSGTPSGSAATWAFGMAVPEPILRVTQLVALLVQDRDPDPAIVADPTGNGEIPAGTDPAAGLDLCGAETPVAYLDLTPPGSATTYRFSKVPINRTVADQPRVKSFGTVTRSLTSRQGDLRGSRFSPVLIDTDRVLRGLEDSDSLVNSLVECYLTSLVGLNAGSTARRVFSGLVTDSEPVGGLLMRLQASGYLQSLLELDPAPTYPQRVFTTDDFPNLANDPSSETSPGNPGLIGKPVPIGYGILSDESLGASARGVIPAWFVGKRLVDGFDWDEYVLFGHAPSPGGILGFFGDISGVRARFDSSFEGVDFLWPGHAGWNAALGSSTLYRDFNSNRYTVFYARGPRSDSARDGRIPFSVNIGGVEDVGDGTGECITSIARQALHLLTNFVTQNWTSGAWLSPPTVNSYSRINTASFETARTRSATRLSTTEGHLGAFLLGWDGSTVTLREMARRWHECGLDLGENKDGQIMASMIDPDAAAARTVSDITDTIKESFRARRLRSEVRNTVIYRYQRRYVPALPEPTPAEGEALPGALRQSQIAWEVDNVAPTPTASSVSKYGTRKLGGSAGLSLELVRDEDTAADIAALNQEVLAPAPVAVGYREGLCGTNVELGDNVDLTHFEGLTASGYSNRALRCEVHQLDLDRFETEIEGLDVEPLQEST